MEEQGFWEGIFVLCLVALPVLLLIPESPPEEE